jgi:putative addiction module component (TIGR02574 family)
MSAQMERLALELLALPRTSRAELAHRLLCSLDDEESPEAAEQWREEIERRCAEIRAGTTECVPADEVMRRARESLR